jgi:hypothetical protein
VNGNTCAASVEVETDEILPPEPTIEKPCDTDGKFRVPIEAIVVEEFRYDE